MDLHAMCYYGFNRITLGNFMYIYVEDVYNVGNVAATSDPMVDMSGTRDSCHTIR